MKKLILLLCFAAALAGSAATVDNAYFSMATPDDSWQIDSDPNALGRMGTRVMLSRSDAKRIAIDLARVDYIDLPFTPSSYLNSQVIRRADIFCHQAEDFSEPADTTLLGFPARRVHFAKQANGHRYLCTAMAANVGFGTLFVITGRQQGQPNVVGRLLENIKFKVDTTRLTTTGQLVRAANNTIKRHPLPTAGNDQISAVALPDTATITFTIIVPYLTRDAVEVPLFVQTKRAEWMKARQEAHITDTLLATAMAERRQLRYIYVDDRRREIGSLLIMPEEYEQFIRNTP